MYCNKCGNEIKYGQRFCTKCGNEIKDNMNSLGTNQYINNFAEKSKKSIDKYKARYKTLNQKQQKAFLMTIIIVFVCIVIGVVIGLNDTSTNNSNIKNTSSKSSTNNSTYKSNSSQGGITIAQWNSVRVGMPYSQVVSLIGYPSATRYYPNGFGYELSSCKVLTYNFISNGANHSLYIVLESSSNCVIEKQNWN